MQNHHSASKLSPQQKVIFTPQFTQQLRSQLIATPQQKRLFILSQGRDWILGSGYFFLYNMHRLFPFIKELRVVCFSIEDSFWRDFIGLDQEKLANQYGDKTIQMLRIIAHPVYSDLIELNLIKCRITTIEGIAFMDMPRVQRIYLAQNHITCLKPFDKTNFPHVKSYNLTDNPTVTQQFSRIHTTQAETQMENPNVKKSVNLHAKDNWLLNENINVVAKLKSRQELHYCGRNIHQLKSFLVLQYEKNQEVIEEDDDYDQQQLIE